MNGPKVGLGTRGLATPCQSSISRTSLFPAFYGMRATLWISKASAVPAMVAARKFIADAAAEAGKTKTINVELKWTFTERADSAPPGVSTAAAG